MAKLIAQSGHTLDLPKRRVTLGESSSCDVTLASGLGLAPRHFEIEPIAGGRYLVRDVSGGAGLTLNGEVIQEHILEHGNVIAAAGLRLGFWNTEVTKEEESPFLAAARPRVAEESLTPPAAVPAKPASPPVAQPASIPAAAVPVSPPVSPAQTVSHQASPPVPAPPPVPPAPPVQQGPPVPPVPAIAQGPPVAWVNPAEERYSPAPAAAVPFAPPPAESQGAAGISAPIPPRKRTLLSRIPRRFRYAGRRAALLAVLGALTSGGYFAWRIPKVQEWAAPLIAKFNTWTNPPPAVTAPSAGKSASAPASAADQTTSPAKPDDITPKTAHNDIVKRMLTERTVSLFQADLRQLVPFYNGSAAARNLPPQREMLEAFQKHYGIMLDGFDRLTCLRAEGKDEFVFILTGSTQLNIEGLLRLPASPPRDTAATAAGKKKSPIRIYPIKAIGRVFGVAQYDPFTVILGKHGWIETTLSGQEGPGLREATCMFPDTAARTPGALIMVERISAPSGSNAPQPFQTSVSNLFFNGKGESRLTLTRNPDVKEETFVHQSSEALKHQFKLLHQAVKLSHALTAPASSTTGKKEIAVPDSGELITTTEASIIIPDGEALLREAIDSVAHTFMSQSPSVELILAAQKAVLAWNQARLQEAPETQSVAGVAEALELLQNGISIQGQEGQRDTLCQIERLEPSQADEITHLLKLEEDSRLVFRPNTDHVTGNLLDLAIKARNYRNAELLISLWGAAKLSAADASDANTAARKVLEWANGPGARQRLSVGLPALTADEYKQAVALLSFQNGQLTWRPGEEGYRTWLRKVSPDPKSDAKRIADIYRAAQLAGAIPNGKVNELSEAVRLLNSGVRARTGSATFSARGYTTDELRAAARYLRFEGGGIHAVER